MSAGAARGALRRVPSVVEVGGRAEAGGWNACEISVVVLVTRCVNEGRLSLHERCRNPSLTRRVISGKRCVYLAYALDSGVNLKGGARLIQRAAVVSLFGASVVSRSSSGFTASMGLIQGPRGSAVNSEAACE